MEHTIIAISVLPVRDPRPMKGRKVRNDQYLALETRNGTVYLRRSAVEEAGGSWQRVLEQARESAYKHGVPFSSEQ